MKHFSLSLLVFKIFDWITSDGPPCMLMYLIICSCIWLYARTKSIVVNIRFLCNVSVQNLLCAVSDTCPVLCVRLIAYNLHMIARRLSLLVPCIVGMTMDSLMAGWCLPLRGDWIRFSLLHICPERVFSVDMLPEVLVLSWLFDELVIIVFPTVAQSLGIRLRFCGFPSVLWLFLRIALGSLKVWSCSCKSCFPVY